MSAISCSQVAALLIIRTGACLLWVGCSEQGLWCLTLQQLARCSTKQEGVQALPEEASVCQQYCEPQVSRAKRPGAAEVAACFQEVERLPALVLTGAKDRRGLALQGLGF